MIWLPCCQSSRKDRLKGPRLKVLAKPTRKVGSVSPIFFTSQQVPSALRPELPTICVALAPSWMRKAPRLVPKPPTMKAGTGRLVMVLRLSAKVRLAVQSKGSARTGVTWSMASTPRLRMVPPLNSCVV